MFIKVKLSQLLISVVLIVAFMLCNIFPQSNKPKEIIWSSNMNIREIAEIHLGNPNLWTMILSYNNLSSMSALKDGRKLLVPQKEIAEVLSNFSETEKIISAAINNGAKIFAQSEIEKSLSLSKQASEERRNNKWDSANSLIKESSEYARAAHKKTLELRDKNADAILSKQKGTVQKRKPNLQSWNNTSLFEKLFEQDLTRTLSSSFAEITFSDLNQIRLNENSQAVILKSRINLLNNKTESQVKLEKGDAYAKLFNTPKKEFNLNIQGVKTKINSDLFWVDKQESQTKVANYKGEISLEAQGSTVVLKENQGSMIPKGKAPTEPKNLLNPPTLISPENLSKTTSANISFNWSTVPEASQYWVEIAIDSRFSSIYRIIKDIKSNEAAIDKIPQGTYYWRVTSVDYLGFPGKFGNYFSFTVEVDTTPPFLSVNLIDDLTFSRNKGFAISVQTEKGVGLSINSNEVKVDDNGEYLSTLNLIDGENIFEFVSVDLSGNKSKIKKSIFAELNPKIELQDIDKNALSNEIIIQANQRVFDGYTRPGALIKIKSDKTKLETSTYTSRDGYFNISIPRMVEGDNLHLVVVSRAGHTLSKKIIIKE